MLEVGGFLAGRLSPYQSLIINCACFRSMVEAFMYLPGLIFYSKMVPHNIEGMMMGFALGIIKFNADVVARCFTAALNVHFQVKMEGAVTGHKTTPEGKAADTIHLATEVELLTPGLGKMYAIQAGLVLVPMLFIWLMAKRARVEEVQVAIHNHDTHHTAHPEDPRLKLTEAVQLVRVTNTIRRTINNDFNLLTQSLMKSRADTEFQKKISESRAAYSGQLQRVSIALKNAKSSQLP
jgi:hypothetical protein